MFSARDFMDVQQILRRLTEIERAIGVRDSLSIRRMIMDAEDYILESQRLSLQTARTDDPRMALGR